MKTAYRYILEPHNGINTRYHCPSCQQKKKTFSRYIDTETGEHVNPSVGRCSRENNCGYHYTPKQYFQDNNISFDKKTDKIPTRKIFPRSLRAHDRSGNNAPATPAQQKHNSFIPAKALKQSLQTGKSIIQVGETNHFIKYLIDLFGIDIADHLRKLYFIGTSSHWSGATVFWQIDTQGKVRTGKIMLYNPATGKRIKEPSNLIHWVHKALNPPGFELRQCLFGEHLLIDKTKPIAIVESEKTAVIANVYLPQFIWLAVGGLKNINTEKCNALKGRNVILFPDLKGFEKWSAKAKELSHLAHFIVSDLLEQKATEAERKEGLDIADYLIRFNLKDFALQETEVAKPAPIITRPNNEVKTSDKARPFRNFKELSGTNKNQSWEQDIIELENCFSEITIPAYPVQLNKATLLTNANIFISNHFAVVKANNGKKTFLPYLERLKELKQVLTTN